MPDLSHSLEQLDEELLELGEGAMMVEELDGFIAGLLVCPELVMPDEWLAIVLNRDPADQQPVFDNIDQANRVFGLVQEHYNSVALTLMQHPKRYRPLFPVDARNGDILWEIWIEGFAAALDLRPQAWQRLFDTDADAATPVAMRGMMALVDAVCGDPPLPEEDLAALHATAPDSIAHWVVVLNKARLASGPSMPRGNPRQPSRATQKIGRNDPCSCGSGKKYKRCCGLN
jgi:uncharacterized protein